MRHRNPPPIHAAKLGFSRRPSHSGRHRPSLPSAIALPACRSTARLDIRGRMKMVNDGKGDMRTCCEATEPSKSGWDRVPVTAQALEAASERGHGRLYRAGPNQKSTPFHPAVRISYVPPLSEPSTGGMATIRAMFAGRAATLEMVVVCWGHGSLFPILASCQPANGKAVCPRAMGIPLARHHKPFAHYRRAWQAG